MEEGEEEREERCYPLLRLLLAILVALLFLLLLTWRWRWRAMGEE
jgi:hypothetical protein